MASIQKAQLSVTDMPRANSPTIHAFIEDQLEAANKEIMSVDAVIEYHEEGSGSGVGSLSSICSSLETEEYTLERLKQAGPEFSDLVDLLENVLDDGEDNLNSSSEVAHTAQ